MKVKGWFEKGKFPKEQQEKLFQKVLYGSDYFLTDQKKSMVTIAKGIIEDLADAKLSDQLCVHNPKSFLFDKPR